MKKLLTLCVTSVLILALCACSNNVIPENKTNVNTAPDSVTQSPALSRQKAIEIALEKAGLTQADVSNLEASLDSEFGMVVWEIEFEHNYTE